MQQRDNILVQMLVQHSEIGTPEDGYYPVKLVTSRGNIHCRYYPVEETQTAAIWVGGVGGDWDTPAQQLYPQLCEELQSEAAIASMRVRYRYSTRLEEAILDVLAAVTFLQAEGITAIALIGHSFGGAVVIQAGVQSEVIRTVVALAPQSYGTEFVEALATRASLLLLHGMSDPILPPECSRNIYKRALEPKQLILYPNAGHGLDEVAMEVHQVVRDWILTELLML